MKKMRFVKQLSALLLVCALLASLWTPAALAEWNGTRQEALNGVVRIGVMSDSTIGWGSGFGVGKAGEPTQYFVTNRHVVVDEETGEIMPEVYLLLEDGAQTLLYSDELVITDVEMDSRSCVRCTVLYPHRGDPADPDIAILKAERVVTERVALPLKSGFLCEQGDTVYAMGYPGSADDVTIDATMNARGEILVPVAASTSSVIVTNGVISRTFESSLSSNGTTTFLHTAQTNHGNSGGPLVTEDGCVVAIHTWGSHESDGYSEYHGAPYIDYAMQKLDSLGISYDTNETIGKKSAPAAVIAALAIAVAAIAIIAVLLLTKRGGSTEYRIQGVSGEYAGRRFPIKGVVRLGRSGGHGSLRFSNPRISSLHCQLVQKGMELYLMDCRSSNGTFLNGVRIAPDQPVRVKPGDSFCLASVREAFVIDVSHH